MSKETFAWRAETGFTCTTACALPRARATWQRAVKAAINVGALNRLRALKASSWTERQGVTMPHTGASALPKRCRRAPIARFMQVALATPASGARIRNTCTTASAGQVVWGPGWRNTCPGSTAGNAGRRSPAATRSTKSPAAPRANVQKLRAVQNAARAK